MFVPEGKHVFLFLGGPIMNRILFYGAGSIAEAIIHGLAQKSFILNEHIFVTNKQNKEKIESLHTTYGVTPVENLQDAVKQSDLIILAMKPKDVAEALEAIQTAIQPHTPILSIVAGYSMASIANIVQDRPLIRMMPNTSAQIGQSTTGVAFNNAVSTIVKKEIMMLLQTFGTVVEVDEDQLHAVTALSGSGPAYFYYVVEAMKEAGLAHGLSNDIVDQLIVETMAGAAEMLKTVDEEPDVLRKKITSPGGTTAAGIDALQQFNVKQAFINCVHAAEKKSRDLANS